MSVRPVFGFDGFFNKNVNLFSVLESSIEFHLGNRVWSVLRASAESVPDDGNKDIDLIYFLVAIVL